MRRGTTPTITFNLPFNVSTVRNVEVYFAQNDGLVFEKDMEDCVLSGTTLAVTLTQAETLLLDDEEKLKIQARFVFTDGSVDATEIIKGKVKEILKDGEIDVNTSND